MDIYYKRNTIQVHVRIVLKLMKRLQPSQIAVLLAQHLKQRLHINFQTPNCLQIQYLRKGKCNERTDDNCGIENVPEISTVRSGMKDQAKVNDLPRSTAINSTHYNYTHCINISIILLFRHFAVIVTGCPIGLSYSARNSIQ